MINNYIKYVRKIYIFNSVTGISFDGKEDLCFRKWSPPHGSARVASVRSVDIDGLTPRLPYGDRRWPGYFFPTGKTDGRYDGVEEVAMPIHDWTRVDAGTFHDFHQGWTIEIHNSIEHAEFSPTATSRWPTSG